MNIIIDLEQQLVVSDFTNRNPVDSFSLKGQDTPLFAVYFVQRGINYNLGSAPGLRFGLFTPGNPNPIVSCTSFVSGTDQNNRVVYRGYPNFNTTAMAGAIAAAGSSGIASCLGEFRFQTSGGTIARTQDVTFNVQRVLLSETIIDNTTAAFTTPAVGSNVTIAISSTSWLTAGLILSIGAGAGNYTVQSITDATHFVAQNDGGTSNAASGTSIPTGTTVGIAPATVISTYPDPSVIEITTHKGAANGYAGLDANTLLLSSRIPVDGQTIVNLASGKIGTSSIITSVLTSFTTPAVNATVSVNVGATGALIVGQYVRIPIAGYYIVVTITDSTHVVLQNNGDPYNAAAGTTVNVGAVLLPAQAAAGGGTAGQNAYTTLSAGFTVPAIGATVPITVGSTAWMGGAGYALFITGAGYYLVNSITDATHLVVTNSGSAANQPPGTTVPSGGTITSAGPQGTAGATGASLSAYDALTASFIQPAVSGTVAITISNTAWLSVNQIIYIASGGYYQVTTVANATTLNVTNLAYPGNATAGATVASGSKVSPAGLQGPQGAGGPGLNAYSTLSANFTQPAINSNVTINVSTTAWMPVGQGIFVQGGGYYTVASISDLTHAVVTNLGGSSNPSAGSTVTGSGTQPVTPSGTPGPAGPQGIQGPQGPQGAVGPTGGIGEAPTDGQLYGRKSSAWSVVPAGGGGGPFNPMGASGGVYIYEEFLWYQTDTVRWSTINSSSGGISELSTYGKDSTHKAQGIIELSTGTAASNACQGFALGYGSTGGAGTNNNNGLFLGLGTLDIAFRVALEGTLPATGLQYFAHIGLFTQSGSFSSAFPGWPNLANAGTSFILLDYSPDNNSGNFRIGYVYNSGSTAAAVWTNCSAGPTGDTFQWWELQITAAGVCTAYLNGTSIGSVTIPSTVLGVTLNPFVSMFRGAVGATNFAMCVDTLYLNYPYSR